MRNVKSIRSIDDDIDMNMQQPKRTADRLANMQEPTTGKEPGVRMTLCLLGAVVSLALGGCTAAVPYAISAAQMVTTGNALVQSQPANPTVQQSGGAADSAASQERSLPYRLIAENKYDEALPILRERVDSNDAQAQGQLGMLYYEGKGVPEDHGKAAEWMQRSAEGGNADSQYMLAWFHYKGIGVPQDYAKTFEWAEKSWNQGNANAATLLARLHRLGHGTPQNYSKAMEYLNVADRAGSISAPAQIAYMYKTGQGVQRDYRQAIDWYSKAGEKGHARGWTHLAYLYATCRDPHYVDGKKAVVYALKATEKDPHHFASWAALAAAYARNNEMEKAVAAAVRSDGLLQANTKLGEAEKQDAIARAQRRMAAYTDGMPYTEENEADEEL